MTKGSVTPAKLSHSARWPSGVRRNELIHRPGELSANLLNPHFQLGKMRAPPVNLPAPGATPELVIIDSCKRLELLHYFSFLNFLKQRIAMKAARKWHNGREKLKSTDYFDCLRGGFLRAWVIAMLHNRVHQEAAVAGKQCAVFALHCFE